MKSILIVEDSQEKVRNLIQAIRDIPGGESIQVSRVSSTLEAARKLEKVQFDVMILDLVIPVRDEDIPVPENSINFLKEINGRIALKKPFVIIGTTEHDAFFDQWRTAFEEELWYLLLTTPIETAWIQQLSKRLTYLFASVSDWQRMAMYQSRADVCIITTVSVETKYVRSQFGPLKEIPRLDDCVTYYSASCESEKDGAIKKVSVVCVETGTKGMAAAAAIATKCIYEYRPKWLIMCGIAAGVKNKTNFGDILLPSKIIDYVAGKVKKTKGKKEAFYGDSAFVTLNERWAGKFNKYSSEGALMPELLKSWNGSKPAVPPKFVVGPIATGSSVVQSDDTIVNLLERFRDIIGVEMEAYGLGLAAKSVAGPQPEFFCFKAVSDFADAKKNDTWQEYASFLSARFTKAFISDYFFKSGSD